MMSMVNQAAVEALTSATYVENYLDTMDTLPDDVQRIVSHLCDLDRRTNTAMRDIIQNQESMSEETDSMKKRETLLELQAKLIKSQELWDQKLNLVTQITDTIDTRSRQLDQDHENLDPSTVGIREEKSKPTEVKSSKVHQNALPPPPKSSPTMVPRTLDLPVTPAATAAATTSGNSATKASAGLTSPPPSAGAATSPGGTADSKAADSNSGAAQNNKVKRQRRQRTHAEANTKEEEKKDEEERQPKKKKKRKAKNSNKNFEKTLVGEPIDPDEPTYCLCEQVSYGDMIGCDNDACVLEWFHFNCVSLTTKPKGKWYCPKCRGDRPNVKRADLK